MIKINNLITRLHTAVTLLFLAFGINNAFAADCDSINDELTSKFRYLGSWDENGAPKYLEIENDVVTQELINYVNQSLPESVKVPGDNQDYFGDDVQLNTELKEKSKVYLTMVHEGASWKNTLGFYTYDIHNPPQTVYDIDSLVVLFPNVSQPNVIIPGNKVLLGEFPAETGIGYFLIAQGWVGDTICIPSHIVFTDTHLNTFTSEEYQQQTILLNYEPEERLLLCFEDIQRPGGDNDFNDAVFFVSAEPGAIDTTDIPIIPTAKLVGDTTLCDINAPAEITVSFTGKAPWSITYTNGTEEITLNDITESAYTFETFMKDSIRIKSFSDAKRSGVYSGHAIVNVSQPSATLSEDHPICSDGGEINGFVIDLEGIAPYSLTYSINGEEFTIDQLNSNQYELSAEVGQSLSLISMNDQYCSGEVSDESVVVKELVAPSLTVEGSGIICGNDNSTSIDLSFDGEGPWIINYLMGEEEISLDVSSNEYQLNISEATNIQFQSLSDANCTTLLSNSIETQIKDLPTVNIVDYEPICGDESAIVTLNLEGEGPWSIEYLLNEESKYIESTESSIQLTVEQSGLFELVGVTDSYCENTATGNQEIQFLPVPTAIISGDAAICDNAEATVQIALTGTAPYSFLYSDGENEVAVTTEETIYEFVTSDLITYSLVSMEDANCSGTVKGSASITDGSEDLNVEINAEEISCFGEDVTLQLIGDTDNLSITWTTEGQGSLENTDQLSTTYSPTDNETGSVVFYAEVSNGCAIKTVSKVVTIIEKLDADFSVSPNKNLLTNTQITFTPNSSLYDEYSWDFGDENTSSATIASNEYIRGGIFEVNLTVSLSGCEDSGSTELEVLAKDELYIPNAFHPYAQNSENQVVKVYGNNIDDNDFFFKIVNRWGKVMYETSNFQEANTVGWNGVNNNTGDQQELNVFTYIVRGKFIEGESFEKTGTITQVK